MKEKGMKVINPMCAQDRSITIPRRRDIGYNADLPGTAVAVAGGAVRTEGRRTRQTRLKRNTPAMAAPGIRKKALPFSPSAFTKITAINGPKAKPRFPPTPKMDMPVAFFSPAKKLEIRHPSG